MKIRFTVCTVLMVTALALSVVGMPRAAKAQLGIKVAVITPSAKNDLAWSQSMVDALNKAKEKHELDITISEGMFQVPDAAAAMRDYATEGFDIVIAHGTQYGASMFEVAADFPEVTFAWGTATDYGKDKGLTNVIAYEARAEEGGYVNGVMAALLSKSGVLGVVGPVNAGDAKLYIDGFTAGAKSTKADIDVKVIFTQNFGDIPAATEAAKTLISQGADVLTGSAQQVPGAISEIQKAKGFWFGTQSNQADGWPDTVVAVQVFDWTSVIEGILELRSSGESGGKAYEISLANGGLKIVFNDKVSIPAEVKAAGEAAIKAISDGTILVPGNPKASEPTPEATAGN